MQGRDLAHRFSKLKNILIALTAGTTISAALTFPAPALAWEELIQQAVGTTVNVIQENGRRNAQIRTLQIQAQERAIEKAIQAEVERRISEANNSGAVFSSKGDAIEEQIQNQLRSMPRRTRTSNSSIITNLLFRELGLNSFMNLF